MTKKSDKTPKGKGDLKKLFPEKTISISEDFEIRMRPLPLGKLPEVMGAFQSILQKAGPDKDPMKVAFEAMSELLTLLPHCIIEKIDVAALPTSALPELLVTFLEQNLTPEVVGKWKTLVDQVQALGLGQIVTTGSGQ